jgi:hypothetical protein
LAVANAGIGGPTSFTEDVTEGLYGGRILIFAIDFTDWWLEDGPDGLRLQPPDLSVMDVNSTGVIYSKFHASTNRNASVQLQKHLRLRYII